MNNYVLNRTNVLLGGQMKWDLRVKSINDSTLYVDDFSLTPISHNINYVRPDVSILNNSHHDNIKELYSKTSDTFFSDCLDAKFVTKYPIIVDDKTKVDSYNSMYDNCVSRISRAKNGKSTQLFIPMWLEDFGISDTIKFDIEIFIEDDLGNKTTSLYKTLELDSNSKESHNNFVNYMRSYIDSISTNGKIEDKIINVDFKNLKMIVEGIDLKTGYILTKDISNKLHNFTGLYKPFMDNDDMIIRSLSDNNLVAKQLFNFNIMFDFEDILSNYILEQIKGSLIKFNIKTFINNKEVEEKSFSWDYSEKFNDGALKELQDYNNIQLIDKNKINTNVIHWVLNKDKSYIFNNYPKFTYNTNLWSTDCNNYKDCLHWCNNDITQNKSISPDWNITGKNLLDIIKGNITSGDFSIFTNGYEIVNNVYYNGYLPKGNNYKDLHLYMMFVNNLEGRLGEFSDTNIKSYTNNNKYEFAVYLKNEYNDYFEIVLMVDDSCKEKFTFKGLFENDKKYLKLLNRTISEFFDSNSNEGTIKPASDEENGSSVSPVFPGTNNPNIGDVVKPGTGGPNIEADPEMPEIGDIEQKFDFMFDLETKLSRYKESNILPYGYSIIPISSKSPLQDLNKTLENDFIKSPIWDQYLFRYDGEISPMFVNPKDNQYWQIKKITRDEYVKDWDNLVKTKFLPLYPSINYFYLELIDKNDSQFENKWFKDSIVYVLRNELNFELKVELQNNVIQSPIEEYIKDYVKNYYNIKDNNVLEQVYNLYNVKYVYDYDTIKSGKDIIYKYNYKVNLKLK